MKYILLLILVSACGKSADKSSPASSPTSQEENPGSRIRYSSVTVEENCGFWTDCDFIVRGDYNIRPIVLSAHFVDNSGTVNGDTGACDFTVTLTDEEARRLESAADRLRTCSVRNNPTADRGFDGLFLLDTHGTEKMVYKFPDGGQMESGRINYLCGGRNAYYSILEGLVVPKAPAECPQSYQRLFR